MAGNHEDFFISFLAGINGACCTDAFETCRQGDYFGLLELCDYGSDSLTKDVHSMKTLAERESVWQQLKNERRQILENMRKDPEGQKILNAICSFKLAIKTDDTLFIHTDPTLPIMKTITQHNNPDFTIDKINNYYQKGLRNVLFEDKETDPAFNGLRDVFLNTSNRDYFWDQAENLEKLKTKADDVIDEIKNQGINAIIHGHTYRDNFEERNGLIVNSVDTSAGNYHRRSILRIQKNGNMDASINYHIKAPSHLRSLRK